MLLMRVDLYQDRIGVLWLLRVGDDHAVQVPDPASSRFAEDADQLASDGWALFASWSPPTATMRVRHSYDALAPSRLIATWDDGRIGPGNAAPSLEARAYLGLG